VLGIVLRHHPDLQQRVLGSALAQFPVVGSDLSQPGKIGGGTTGVVVGVLGSLYGGLGVAQALQNAMNTAWAIPKNSRPNPFKSRAISLLLLGTIGLGVLATTALTAIIAGAGSLTDDFGIVFQAAVILASVALNTVIFATAFRISTARPLTFRNVAPGAITAAAAWQLLQGFGAAYVKHVAHSGSQTSGVFGVVLGLLAFLYLASTVIMLCVEINVVRLQKLYPRALLTPFTDDVDLTTADEAAYTDQAEAQRAKGFQNIDVTFTPDEPRE
jgi:membrane protein